MSPIGISHSPSSPGIEHEDQAVSHEPQEAAGTKSPFHYAAQPPIEDVHPGEVHNVVSAFTDSVDNYAKDHNGGESEHLKERANDSKEVLQSIGTHGSNPENKVSAYNLGDGHKAAMMMLHNEEKHMEVSDLVTHPGASGAGEAMIEHAVNKSEAAGHGGKLGLTSLSEESGKFYKSVGFKGDPEGDMTLNPSKNPEKWTKKEDGTWSLNKNEGKGYLTGKK